MNKNWISFKDLKQNITFEQVMEFYEIKDLSPKGGQLVGFCPIPTHNGNRKTPSFSAHPEKGIFQCFGCGAKGNLLDFSVLMEGGDPKRGLDVRKAALKLQKLVAPLSHTTTHSGERRTPAKLLINQPLGFWLKDLEPGHQYLLDRGFQPEVLERFGVGYCHRGVLQGRIAIPLHDHNGILIGYAGRVTDDSAITAKNPKYMFPGRREVEGGIVEFRKSAFLYNGHQITAPVDDLLVVEGFASVWWLTQNGYCEVVAVMGSSASDEQLRLIEGRVNPQGRVWVMTDGDKPGIRCGKAICEALSKKRTCRLVYQDGRQPTDYSESELERLLEASA
jgi:DNA primase